MKEKKEKPEAVCFECSEWIDLLNDKHVTLETHEGDDLMDKQNFHFECWVDFVNRKTKEKAEKIVGKMKDSVSQMIGNMKGLQFRSNTSHVGC